MSSLAYSATVLDRAIYLSERVSSALIEKFPHETPELLHEYAKALFKTAAFEDFSDLGDDSLIDLAAELWNYSSYRLKEQDMFTISNRYIPDPQHRTGQSYRTIVFTVTSDRSFLLDSISQLFSERGIGIRRIFHPVVSVDRDSRGVRLPQKGKTPESMMYFECERVLSEVEIDELELQIRATLQGVYLATNDWRSMETKVSDVSHELNRHTTEYDPPIDETMSFLEWLKQGNFTFLGYRYYSYDNKARKMEMKEESGLGLYREKDYSIFRFNDELVDTPNDFVQWFSDDSYVLISKANRKSPVHRATHLDVISVKSYKDAEIVGEHRFIGLFTSSAYGAKPSTIPLVREKINYVTEQANFGPQSHDGKTLKQVLINFPRDELFQIKEDLLLQQAVGIVFFETRPRVRVFCRFDRFNRFASVMVFLPNERSDQNLRDSVGDYLCEKLNGRVAAYMPWFGETGYVRLHYIIGIDPTEEHSLDLDQMEEQIRSLTNNFFDTLRKMIMEEHGRPILYEKYQKAFSAGYKESNTPEQAVKDLVDIESIPPEEESFVRVERGTTYISTLSFRLFHKNVPVPLADCLPILEKMGLKTLTERPHNFLAHGQKTYLQQIVAEHADYIKPSNINFSILEDIFLSVLRGKLENDAFNRLGLLAQLNVRQITILRAIGRYLKQTTLTYTSEFVENTFSQYPDATVLLISIFEEKFNPNINKTLQERENCIQQMYCEFNQVLESVTSLDQEKILCSYRDFINAILRTNAYQKTSDDEYKPYISFKLDVQILSHILPLPLPYREIWVYSPQVEGVHLRFGQVARGGLRWSDRQDDFRFEVLGLVKAQQVKNTVIVPVGAKGCFYPKQLPSPQNREAWLDEGMSAYKTFIRGLLDVTDNLEGITLIPPQNVLRYDNDDPYLVVAADKGTATFSDIANGLSKDYGFWLGDAFASGGSQGYDHKKMGITAKGAWEAVKRHFREIGTDIQKTPFKVIGVGDMSGDVFGNGMLLSRQIQLIAAFDHRDIFIDPTPNIELSYQERERMFNLPRSSWQDYNKTLISQGGGIFSRKAKSIELTPEIQAITGLSESKVTPNELIKALLAASTDLLWFGGIGTYIKSPQETHTDVSDKANDPIRLDAEQVRARVIGEGANLGVTQRGRIAFARKGGRINTDAVDNSAGVDCSDHEVNIKITLTGASAAGKLTEEKRNILLSEMTDEVSELVLKTNYSQTAAISLEESCAIQNLSAHRNFIASLEEKGILNPSLEKLPSWQEFDVLQASNAGLTRPEIAVLVAYAKLSLVPKILKSDLPDDNALFGLVLEYMPKPIIGMFQDELKNHRLRREIITMMICNRIVHEAGIDFVQNIEDNFSISAPQVMKAFLVARSLLDIDSLYAQIHALDETLNTSLQNELLQTIRKSLQEQTLYLIYNSDLNLNIDELYNHYKDVKKLLNSEDITNILSEDCEIHWKDRRNRFEQAGISSEKACFFASLAEHFALLSFIDLANQTNQTVSLISNQYYKLIKVLDLKDILTRLSASLNDNDTLVKKATQQAIQQLTGRIGQVVVLFSSLDEQQTISTQFSRAVEDIQRFILQLKGIKTFGLAHIQLLDAELQNLIVKISKSSFAEP